MLKGTWFIRSRISTSVFMLKMTTMRVLIERGTKKWGLMILTVNKCSIRLKKGQVGKLIRLKSFFLGEYKRFKFINRVRISLGRNNNDKGIVIFWSPFKNTLNVIFNTHWGIDCNEHVENLFNISKIKRNRFFSFLGVFSSSFIFWIWARVWDAYWSWRNFQISAEVSNPTTFVRICVVIEARSQAMISWLCCWYWRKASKVWEVEYEEEDEGDWEGTWFPLRNFKSLRPRIVART